MQLNFEDVFHRPVRKGSSITWGEASFFVLVSLAALLASVVMFSYETFDYQEFLSRWFQTLKDNGGFAGLRLNLGDYAPSYLTVLAALTYLPLSSLVSIKLVSVLFSYVLAGSVMYAVYLVTQNKNRALGAYAAVLLLPTVLLNGAYWAQCDAIYASFLVLSLIALMKNKPAQGMVFFGLAFCFKLQAIFFAPFILYLFLKNKVKFRQLFLIPLMYVLSAVPAWIAGRSMKNMLMIYLMQTGTYNAMSYNAPNLWGLLVNDAPVQGLSAMAVFTTGALILVALFYLLQKRVALTQEAMIKIAFLFVVLLPFFLPRMHERYFFVADILAVLYAFCCPRRTCLPFLVVGASLISYCPFLWKTELLDLRLGGLMMGAALVIAVVDVLHLPGENDAEVPVQTTQKKIRTF